ncbi:uncharacterized protein SPPG_00585 [Spizellomyces punctatus DAOM BR117]|uniref:t-SNARE coiled-coil homology domain-containing protein n=1 Tax=Spizellomyces punctatus (strain DAOM BR117) TaxID=645134 RepID=A0A0L0HUT1_SPIPD|nr:uncharacterized protein SPPG_00585 [Spizellomyces punctatus DAOM BR117]KND04888.1 hypothetical protein SPPG_00585 [Spizellomyces punctatus DAOM BR117]|eukprot:XP_016612927.1 hypothetical protein SPPG_00585 [Spizellomyces punctatus DAOM BR117]
MPIDRFGSLKQADTSHQTVVEMEGLLTQPSVGGEGLDTFFNEVELMKSDIKIVRRNVGEIERLHYAGLLSANDKENRDALERASNDTKRLIGRLRAKVKDLMEATDRMKPTRNAQIRRTHERSLVNEIVKVAAEYQQMEQQVKQQHRERLERQYKIVRPGATDEEVSNVVEHGGSVFSQEILSARVGEQRQALEEVQSRHVQIKQIETALVELFDLTTEMSHLLDQHQEIINIVDAQVEQVHVTVEKGNRELTFATASAKSARKTKWIIAGIVLVVVGVIAAVVAVKLSQSKSQQRNNA